MTRRLKITMVNKLYPPWNGGMELHVADLSRALLELEERLDIRAIVGQKERARFRQETVDGVLIQRATTLIRAARTPITVGLTGLLREAHADIYHFHHPYPWGELAALQAKLRAPIVVTFQHDIVRQKKLLLLYRPIMHRFLRRADRIVVWSPQTRNNSRVLARYRDKTVIIPGGIETRRFIPTEASLCRAETLRRSLAPNGPVILFVGRLVYYKGLEYLLTALRDVPGTLLLVGSGALKEVLQQQAKELGIVDRVRFLPSVTAEDLPLYYQASDVFVLPSSEATEAFGLVQLEAHTSGIPVICTALPTGVTFVNQHEQTGLVVPPRDGAALANALNTLLDNPELRVRLGRQAQLRAVAEFDISACAGRILKLYRELLVSAPSPEGELQA